MFITFEGIEGVGKSTNVLWFAQQLEVKGFDVELTREPGGTPFAEEIRELLIAPRDESVSDYTELLLMFAARAQHLHAKILPALEQGKVVLCDRFTDATYAYQGGARGMSFEDIAVLEQMVQGDLRPDMTILLDASLEVSLARTSKRGEAADRFEQEKNDFFKAVRHTYIERAEQNSQQYKVVNVESDLETVQALLSEHVELVCQLMSK